MSLSALSVASADVLAVFAANGFGVVEGGLTARPPLTVKEIRKVPAFAAILDALDQHAVRTGSQAGVSPSSAALARAHIAPPSEQAAYVLALGVHVLTWLRHVDSHVYFATLITERSGLTAAVVAQAVQAAALALERADDAFEWADGRLTFAAPAAPQ